MKEIVKAYKDIAPDYAYDGSIFNGESLRLRLVKYIINRRLNAVDRTLIILYADCHSYRKLGARLGISRTTIATEIHRIKRHILEEYRKLERNEHLH